MLNAKLVLAACAVALTLNALAASAASGATAGWMVGGTLLSGSAALLSSALVEKSLIFEVKGAFSITCRGKIFKGNGAELVAPNKIKASSLEFTECQGTTEPCRLNDETVSTVPVMVETALESTLAVIAKLKPQTKSVIATVDFVGETCAFLGVQNVTGTVLVLSATGQDERTTQQSNAITTEASKELKVGSSVASLSTTATTRLTGGQAWSFL
jgi:hypothetical protein